MESSPQIFIDIKLPYKKGETVKDIKENLEWPNQPGCNQIEFGSSMCSDSECGSPLDHSQINISPEGILIID